MARAGAVTDQGTEEQSGAPRYLHDETSVCLGELDRLDWTDVMTVALDGLHVGVRSTFPAVQELLQTALAAHVVDDSRTPPNYSLLIGDGLRGRAKGFHFLYRSSNAHLRTRDARRLVRGLLAHLSSLRTSQFDGLIAAHATCLVGSRGAAIAPLSLRQLRSQIERRLNLRGVRYVDLPWIFLDPGTSEVVVPAPTLQIDAAAMASLDELVPSRREDPPVAAGRYPLESWIFFGSSERPLSRGQALAAAAHDTFSGGLTPHQATLEALALVMRGIEPVTLSWAEPVQLVDPLVELVGGG